MRARQSSNPTVLLDDLKAVVGDKGWTTDPRDLEPHLTEQRGVLTGSTEIMVSPDSTQQVAQIVELCARHGVGVVPQGGNTGLCGGSIPDQSGTQILLSLSRMNRVRSVDTENFSVTAEAGCILADIQDIARSKGLFFPLSLGAEGSCQIGGNLSTNAGGINVLRYGTARDQALGLEVVLADGTVWDGLRSLRKDTAGYDMKQVFIGSEGTLGIITAATLRLYPEPGETRTAMLAIPGPGQAIELLGFLRRRLGDCIQAFELVSDICLQLVTRHVPDTRHPFDSAYEWYVQIEIVTGGDPERVESVLADAMSSGQVLDAVLPKNDSETRQLWHMRHSISEAMRPEGACLKLDISVPVSKIGLYIEQSKILVREHAPDTRPVIFGHVGDGNLHYDILQPVDADPDRFRSDSGVLADHLYALVTRFGGSISAEHGIGTMKKNDLLVHRSPVETGMMRTLKAALDPRNTLNPGKVI